MSTNTQIGIIGCGNISDAYFSTGAIFPFFDIAACADLNLDAAKAKAAQWNIPQACSVDELLADDSLSFIINLTIPQAHGPVMLRCLEAGKHVYTEKPFTVTREEALSINQLAHEKGLRVGSAPDTFLGGAHQTCRQLIDDGAIGDIVGASAFMLERGHEHWHPSPEFYYKKGGGPMFDMGPYYLTDLVQLLGPVAGVSGHTRTTFKERLITSQPKYGQSIEVEVPTHIVGTFEFASGALATINMSFDVHGHRLPLLEIYGTKGTLFVPDPNGFGGDVQLQLAGEEAKSVPLSHPNYADHARGIGMADMIYAIRTGRDHRCNERLAYHVLDLMHAFHDASDERTQIEVKSTCARPAPMPLGVPEGVLD